MKRVLLSVLIGVWAGVVAWNGLALGDAGDQVRHICYPSVEYARQMGASCINECLEAGGGTGIHGAATYVIDTAQEWTDALTWDRVSHQYSIYELLTGDLYSDDPDSVAGKWLYQWCNDTTGGASWITKDSSAAINDTIVHLDTIRVWPFPNFRAMFRPDSVASNGRYIAVTSTMCVSRKCQGR